VVAFVNVRFELNVWTRVLSRGRVAKRSLRKIFNVSEAFSQRKAQPKVSIEQEKLSMDGHCNSVFIDRCLAREDVK
jgi:hypothetical protein